MEMLFIVVSRQQWNLLVDWIFHICVQTNKKKFEKAGNYCSVTCLPLEILSTTLGRFATVGQQIPIINRSQWKSMRKTYHPHRAIHQQHRRFQRRKFLNGKRKIMGVQDFHAATAIRQFRKQAYVCA